MPFATPDLEYLYDQVYADASQIPTMPQAEPDDQQFSDDVLALIRWRKGESEYPFLETSDGDGPGSPGFLDVGLPIALIGNRYPVIDARGFVADTGGYRYRSLGAIERISVHHSVTREPVGKDDELTVLTEIGNFHVYGRDWPGYAYHWTIAPSGRPYYTGDMATSRYVVGPTNPSNVAICLLGNFTDHAPTPAALETLRLLIGEIQFTLGSAIPYLGHRDTPGTEPTSCPGATYQSWLPDLTAQAAVTDMTAGVWSEAEIVGAITASAADRGVPARGLLALAIAESGLDQFAARYGVWPDVSFGLGQQTVKWSPVGDGSDTPENVELVKRYFSDPGNAIPLLADKFAAHYTNPDNPGATDDDRILASLAKYNSNQWVIPEKFKQNAENYRDALADAKRLLGE